EGRADVGETGAESGAPGGEVGAKDTAQFRDAGVPEAVHEAVADDQEALILGCGQCAAEESFDDLELLIVNGIFTHCFMLRRSDYRPTARRSARIGGRPTALIFFCAASTS